MIRKPTETVHRVVAGLLVLLVLASAVCWSLRAEGNDRPLIPATVPGQFSAERARAHLDRFATEPRPLGSPASDRTRDYIAAQLRSSGFTVENMHALGARSAKGSAIFGRVDNVIATLPGRAATGTVLLAAHYDSAATGPGASDDGAAVAAMLEVARSIGADGGLRNDLVLLFTDGEEDGLLGAEAFVREHPLGRAGGVVLNWEARGVSGPSLMFETSPANAELVSLFSKAVPDPRGDSSMVEIYRYLPNDTDFSQFSAAGFAGLNFAYIEQPSYYHTAGDSLTNLDPRSLQHHGENMLSLTRALGAADLPALRSDRDATYFRFGTVPVTYSSTPARPLAALAVALVVALAVLAHRRGRASASRMMWAAVAAALPFGVSIASAQVIWLLIAALRPDYAMMNGLLYRPYSYQVAIAALTTAALLLWYLLLRARLGSAALVTGALVWPAGAGVVCAVIAPGASFLFVLPTLFAAAGVLAAMLPVRRPGWSAVCLAAGLSVSAVMLPVMARGLFTGVGLAFGGAGAACLTLFGLLLLPVVELLLPESTITRRAVVVAPMLAVTVAIASVGAGLVLDTVDAAHPRRSHLAYVLDADTGAAHWVSGERHPTTWTREYLTGHDLSGLPPGYTRGPLWTGRAEPLAVAGPRLAIRHREGDTVTVHVDSPRSAESLTLRIDHPIDLVTASVPGTAPVTVAVSGSPAHTWPGEIRFRDLPSEGVELTIRTPGAHRVRVTVIDETRDIAAAPGFRPRPEDVVAAPHGDGDLIAVARTYEM
ncbi:M20/M25/M40 family metallo-hydrolase [Nocardia paucivorans]|uniref:M20/M25/M40 family metallo-hydrolase n=1 Tax=Nocardia paucivorans TaxID=114259 RepID=UPI0002DA0E90|nr:M20/M25/M40 family metallo-hydrolase [Nocardia paucivorans]